MNLHPMIIVFLVISVIYTQQRSNLESFTWTDFNGTSFISQVKNQNFPAACNSGWAFSTIDVYNSRIKIRRQAVSPDISISVQVLLSCDTFNYGCLGGQPLTAFSWMQRNNITDESCHSYTAKGYTNGYGCSSAAKCQQCKDSVCKSMPNSKIYSVADYGTISGVQQMQEQISSWGPIACGINSDLFNNYTSGIMRQNSTSRRINHFVTVYGWDSQNGVSFWRVKNSWGPGWGQSGHFRIELGKNLLGIEGRCFWGNPTDTWTQDIRNKTVPNEIIQSRIKTNSNLALSQYLTPSRSYLTPHSCQSSAAFSVIQMIADRQSIISHGKATFFLSAQSLLNCGIYKCSKQGNPIDILTFIQKNGLSQEGCQTYSGISPQKQNCSTISNCAICSGPLYGFKCNAVNNYKRWKIKSHGVVSGAANIKNQLVHGPIVCGIQLTKSFENYKGGIFSEITINPKIDHYVEIISHGKQGNKQFWIGRNHWGTSWGQSSFFRIQMGKNVIGVESKCYFANNLL